MVSICLYFQVHQPFRVRNYTVFEIGKNSHYFDEHKNSSVLRRVADKCYLPANAILMELLDKHPEFRASFSMSGTALEQFERYAPEVLESFKALVDTGRVEVLDETYHHSLAYIYSKEEFKEQVRMHMEKVRKLFRADPRIFRNTELIYNNEMAHYIEKMGYKGVLAEGADHILGWRSPNFLYRPKTTTQLKLLLKNYRLSDDIAFRFSEKSWSEYPLTADKFGSWVSALNGNGACVNLFMDYETFGEHQWRETGIFDFLRHMPSFLLQHPDNSFKTPSELVSEHEPVAELDIHTLISWADLERDLSAWLGNNMQQAAIKTVYDMENEVKETQDPELIEDWRRLQTSDHYYYMCTKWFADGDVHKYFNPYDSPYDAFISFMNILNDLKIRIKEKA
ncbi:polysaccharide deacetylase family protein [Candidatus Woesearchaeota archaeon]|nr:polysaccharide deacetylase family protein [Candidatus Woesearchaeota archaeon]